MSKNEHTALWALRALTTSLFLLFLLIAVASFLPGARLWGVNHLAFYGLPVRIALLILMALAFLPRIARTVYTGLAAALQPLLAGGWRSWIVTIVLALVLAAGLFAVRIDIHLMDEGRFLRELVAPGPDGTTQQLVDARDVLEYERLAPGTLVLYLLAAKAGAAVSGWGVPDSILLLNLILLAVLIVAIVRFAVASRMKPPAALIFLCVLVLSGTLALFAGYLTKYAPFFVFAALYLLAAFRYLEGRSGFASPALLCIVSLAIHIFAILLLPSFLYLLIHRMRRERVTSLNRQIMIAVVIVTTGLALAAAINPALRIYYLPLFGTSEKNGILSPGHIADIFNLLLLAVPALPLLLSVPSIRRRLPGARRGGAKSDDAAATEGRRTLESHFALLLLVPWLLFLLLLTPQVAFAREWDRYILASLGVMPVTVVGMKRLLRSVIPTERALAENAPLLQAVASVITPAVIISLILSVVFIGVNSSPGRSGERFERLLGFEKKSAAQGYARLYFYYFNQGKLLPAGQAAERAYGIDPNPANALNLSMLYVAREDTLGAIDMLSRELSNDPSAHLLRHQLITLLDRTGNYHRVIDVCKDGIRREPDEPQYYYFLGKSYLYLGRLREGVEALQRCAEMNPPQQVRRNIEALMGRLRKKN